MKWVILLLFLTVPVIGFTQIRKEDEAKCVASSQGAYDSQMVLEELAAMLNKSIPDFRKYEPEGFSVEKGQPRKFFVYDLTDPSLKSTPLGKPMPFTEGHVYHVSAIYLPFSKSHIVILEHGHLKVFRSVNCRNGGDSIEDVTAYVSGKLNNDSNRDAIVSRVRKYRDYGIYFTIDDTTAPCD